MNTLTTKSNTGTEIKLTISETGRITAAARGMDLGDVKFVNGSVVTVYAPKSIGRIIEMPVSDAAVSGFFDKADDIARNHAMEITKEEREYAAHKAAINKMMHAGARA